MASVLSLKKSIALLLSLDSSSFLHFQPDALLLGSLFCGLFGGDPRGFLCCSLPGEFLLALRLFELVSLALFVCHGEQGSLTLSFCQLLGRDSLELEASLIN